MIKLRSSSLCVLLTIIVSYCSETTETAKAMYLIKFIEINSRDFL